MNSYKALLLFGVGRNRSGYFLKFVYFDNPKVGPYPEESRSFNRNYLYR